MISMTLHFNDADPVATCGGCGWHTHGDAVVDAVTAWARHVTSSEPCRSVLDDGDTPAAVFERAFRAVVAQDAHVVGAQDAHDDQVCGPCFRWAVRVMRGSITRHEVDGRCAQGRRWQQDINAALKLIGEG